MAAASPRMYAAENCRPSSSMAARSEAGLGVWAAAGPAVSPRKRRQSTVMDSARSSSKTIGLVIGQAYRKAMRSGRLRRPSYPLLDAGAEKRFHGLGDLWHSHSAWSRRNRVYFKEVEDLYRFSEIPEYSSPKIFFDL